MRGKRKRGAFAAAVLMAAIMICASGEETADMTLKIDPGNVSQVNGGVFEGWGTSLCWWANRVGYSDMLAQAAAEAFCDPEKGLGLNILRYNIGGGDDPSHDHITRTDSMMPGFWKNPVYREETGEYSWDYDWSQDANQRNVLEKCLAVYGDGMLVEGFSNSPPYFMTNSGCSSGAKRAFQNNLKDDAYDAFARYLADVAEHFAEEWGIRFQSMSPMNEPDTSYWGAYSNKQEGCHFDSGEAQSRILKALADQLTQKGMTDILISGTDETSIDSQTLSLTRLSEDALAVISRVDTHTYGGSGREFLRSQTLLRGKNLWMSEVDGGDTLEKDAGEMGAGLWLAQRIADDLNGLTPSAWILWQVIDSHICRDGYLGRQDTGMVNTDGGYWGTAVADHDRQELILTMKYYVLGQFTRYIRPGSRLIEMKGSAVAALDEAGRKLTVVIVNSKENEQTACLDLSGFGNAFPEGSRVRAIRTSGSVAAGEHWTELPEESTGPDGVTVQLVPYSVTTFIIEGD